MDQPDTNEEFQKLLNDGVGLLLNSRRLKLAFLVGRHHRGETRVEQAAAAVLRVGRKAWQRMRCSRRRSVKWALFSSLVKFAPMPLSITRTNVSAIIHIQPI